MLRLEEIPASVCIWGNRFQWGCYSLNDKFVADPYVEAEITAEGAVNYQVFSDFPQ